MKKETMKGLLHNLKEYNYITKQIDDNTILIDSILSDDDFFF